MEWNFLKRNGDYSEQCPKERVIELAKLFLNNGYIPFHVKEPQRHPVDILLFHQNAVVSGM